MGENLPTTYDLQYSAPSTYGMLNIYILCYLIFLFFTNVHNLLQAQGVDKVMKFPFRNSNVIELQSFG